MAMREARSGSRPAAWRGFGTKRMAISAATRRERAAPWSVTLRCFPREDGQRSHRQAPWLALHATRSRQRTWCEQSI